MIVLWNPVKVEDRVPGSEAFGTAQVIDTKYFHKLPNGDR